MTLSIIGFWGLQKELDGIALESQAKMYFSHTNAIGDARGVVATLATINEMTEKQYTTTEPSHRRVRRHELRLESRSRLENLCL